MTHVDLIEKLLKYGHSREIGTSQADGTCRYNPSERAKANQ